jgi:hypothetical protein
MIKFLTALLTFHEVGMKLGTYVGLELPPDLRFVGNIPNNRKIYQITTKYTKRHKNRTNVHKIYQHLPLQVPPKFTQIGIFGSKNMPSGNPDLKKKNISV